MNEMEKLPMPEESGNLKINEDAPEIGLQALNTQDLYINHSAEYVKTSFQHMHLASEILFVEQGVAEYICSGEKYIVKKGDVLILGSMDFHQMRVVEAPYIRYGLAITPSYVLNRNSLHVFRDLLKTHDSVTIRKIQNMEEEEFAVLCRMLHLLKRELTQKQILYLEETDAYLMLILARLFRKMELSNLHHDETGITSTMEAICKYINESYSEEITLESLSHQFYCNPSTISREFKKYTGKNVNYYINSVRVAMAVQYLEQTQLSITEICYQCGYASINTFLRRFGGLMGISPLQYRKEYNAQKH